MGKMTYTNLMNASVELYLKGDYLEAYNFITQNSSKVKGNDAQIYNFRYCFACKAGLYELAMEIMKEAVTNKKYWYSYEYLIEDDDLKPLREFSEFYELANICKEREHNAKINSKPVMKILTPKNITDNEKNPLLIALHGNEENILITEDYWSPCVMNNYILALPQSSQIGFSHGYFWNDIEMGSKELKEQYDKALEKYEADLDNIIIGGFSAGARVVLYSILNDIIKVKGFILVSPWLPEIETWKCLLDKLKINGIKAYVICGDKDEDCIENSKKLVEMLNQKNVSNVFKIVENLNHDYPDNFHDYLKDAIKFINL